METLTFFEAVILGFVQGLTEFLPISSSGHLVIAQHLLGLSEPPVVFDVLLHAATLAAVIIYFRATLLTLSLRLWWLVGLATIPAVIGGVILSRVNDYLFASFISLGLGFLLTAYWVYRCDQIPKGKIKLAEIRPRPALVIGIFQAIAILPSVSRSGATLYAGLKTGLNRQAALSFAFIISIPAILGANLYELISLDSPASLPWLPVITGMITAFITGFFCLRLLTRLFMGARLLPFAIYSAVVGSLCLIWGIMTYGQNFINR